MAAPSDKQLVTHRGGCHCGAVRYELSHSPSLRVIKCSCSLCVKKQNLHFIIPRTRFTLLQGEDKLTTYTFNTHAAQHRFCSICGVQSFYVPRSNPDGIGVMPHCLDPGTVTEIVYEDFDGKNWEDSIVERADIRSRSTE